MRVLFCIIDTSGVCSQGLAISLMRLQNALSHAPNINITVHAAGSLGDAAREARKEGFEALVAVEHNITFPAQFVLRGLVNPEPFVVGIYPLPTLDWGRVASTPRDCKEDLRFRGNTYNLDPGEARHAANGYVVVPRAQLGAVVMKGAALEAIAASSVTCSDAACAAWGKDIHADLDNPCQLMGQMVFMGCMGARAFLPEDTQKNLSTTATA